MFRTLIVDDEPIARRVLCDELTQYSDIAIVAEAEDGVCAMRLIEHFSPDLVFLDLQMPRMTGFEVIQSAPRNSTKIVVVTGCEQSASTAVAAGAVAYLLKPVNPTCLRMLLDWLRRNREADHRLSEAISN